MILMINVEIKSYFWTEERLYISIYYVRIIICKYLIYRKFRSTGICGVIKIFHTAVLV